MDMNIEILGSHVDRVVRNLERFSREVKPLGGIKASGGVVRREKHGIRIRTPQFRAHGRAGYPGAPGHAG